MQLFPMLFASAGAGATAAATTAGTVAATAAPALSLSSLLQGTLTVLGVASTLAAGSADAQAAELAAEDAKQEKDLENLQGIERKASIKRDMMDALGAQDVAYAGSGVDLSFGTAAQARKDAYRAADVALTGDAVTTMTRMSRLTERAANYRSQAKRLRAGAAVDAFSQGIKGALSIGGRY